MNGSENRRKSFWKSLSAPDWVAFGLCVLGLVASWAESAAPGRPGWGLLRLLGLFAAFYLLYRFWSRWRNEFLWSLRNRLIVAYLFIAIVPIILLSVFATRFGQVIYSQLGAYLLYHDIEDRLEMLADTAATIAAAEKAMPALTDEDAIEQALAAEVSDAQRKQLPGLTVKFGDPKEFRLRG